MPTREEFQRLFMMSEPEILPLNAQAALGPAHAPERSQFAHLYRHFLERFFSHESASPDGDAKTRMVQIACAAGLPGFAVALYLFPLYHPYIGWPPGNRSPDPPPYWVQVNHHFFFIVYAFVSMGIATVFEWDMFFPDLLDVLVLGALPIAETKVFLARVAAIALFVGGFLLDANILAPLVLPSTTEPANLTRFLAGHLAAVAMSGLFAAAFVLALQGSLLAVLGERWFRKFSLALQGLGIAALLMLMLLFPVFSGITSVLLRRGGASALWFPPFWFLGVDQRLLEGPAALPIYGELARTACLATAIAVLVAVVCYPIAYLRKVRGLVEGPGTKTRKSRVLQPVEWLLNASLLRSPTRRAVFHFISRTILRVPRYRIYLVLYGGVGVSVVVATILRFTTAHNQVHLSVSADGVRAAAGIVAFWTIAGLRMAFVSPGNQRGSWLFDIAHGKPPYFKAAMERLLAAELWTLLAAGAATLAVCAALYSVAPPDLHRWPAVASQWLVGGGLCLLLTDAFFLNVTVTAFTGEPPRGHSNLALTVLKYYAFFPLVMWIPPACEPWIESHPVNFVFAAMVIALAHVVLLGRHLLIVKDLCIRAANGEEEDEESFLKLGLGSQSL
jgi:hypothetical protein